MLVLYLGPREALAQVQANLPESFRVRLAIDESGVNHVLPDCDVILDAYMKMRFPADRINVARNLKLFVTATTGSDHIDASALEKRGIPLFTLRGEREALRNVTAAAEHSWLLLLACARQLPSAVGGVLVGEWNRNKYPGVTLRGKTLGIIGCGRIGGWMARYGAAFGMKCLGFDPYINTWPKDIDPKSLQDLLRSSDFITLHVPLVDETYRLLGTSEFTLMKRGAIFINTSRGDVVDESALLSALENGFLTAAGLDVLSGEPEIAGHPLVEYAKKHHNLIITPHIGGFSPDALRQVLTFSCQRIVNFFQASKHDRTDSITGNAAG
jgi:D-3-phosphoglycerate dehydrogenase